MIALKFATTLKLAGITSLGAALAAAFVTAPVLADTDKGSANAATDMRGSDWNTVVERKDGAHKLGNPNAPVQLTEYVSYTCPHCATFARQGDPALKFAYVSTGRVSVEVRHVIRDSIDWTAAVLANCGAPDKFLLNHALFMSEQPKWLAEAQNATTGQKQRWSNPNRTAAHKAIASDLGFEELMERRGYSRVEINTCLADNSAATQLAIQSIEEAKRMGVSGTPSFALNGQLLNGTHSWQPLQMQIDGLLAAQKGR